MDEDTVLKTAACKKRQGFDSLSFRNCGGDWNRQVGDPYRETRDKIYTQSQNLILFLLGNTVSISEDNVEDVLNQIANTALATDTAAVLEPELVQLWPPGPKPDGGLQTLSGQPY